MSFGRPERGNHPWSLDEEASRPAPPSRARRRDQLLRHRQRLLGRHAARRSSAGPSPSSPIATDRPGDQGARTMRKAPNGAGLSRKAILTEIDDSLRRLGPTTSTSTRSTAGTRGRRSRRRWRRCTTSCRAGKARYIGASSMWAWQFAKAQHVADLNGWTRFVSMQNHYNLLYREEEREMMPLCVDQGVGVIPWSPLARGRLTRDWDEQTARSETDEFGKPLYRPERSGHRRAGGRGRRGRGVPRAQVALAWVLRQPAVTAPIVGVDEAASTSTTPSPPSTSSSPTTRSPGSRSRTSPTPSPATPERRGRHGVGAAGGRLPPPLHQRRRRHVRGDGPSGRPRLAGPRPHRHERRPRRRDARLRRRHARRHAVGRRRRRPFAQARPPAGLGRRADRLVPPARCRCRRRRHRLLDAARRQRRAGRRLRLLPAGAHRLHHRARLRRADPGGDHAEPDRPGGDAGHRARHRRRPHRRQLVGHGRRVPALRGDERARRCRAPRPAAGTPVAPLGPITAGRDVRCGRLRRPHPRSRPRSR